MDGRREPRFQIYAPAKLASLDSPDRELDCLLLDISATGMKFVIGESLSVDEVVAIEVEDHLVLADVRYAEARGDKFAIGAERIHAVDKTALPEDKNRAEQIRFVVDDYRSRIRLAIAGEKSPAKKPEPELPVLHRDQAVEAAVLKLIEQWRKESESSTPPEATLRAAIVERPAERVLEQTPIRAESGTAQRRRVSWRVPVATAGAIAIAAFTVSLFWSYRHSAAANATHPIVIASQQAEVKTAPAPASPRHAEIHVTEPVWVYAVSDGREIIQKLLTADETRQIEFVDRALVRVGNAGGVEISVDGKSIGPLGPRGKIRALEITAAGHQFIPLDAVHP